MASAPPLTTTTRPAVRWGWAEGEWPSSAKARWALRLLFALPFAALSAYCAQRGYLSGEMEVLTRNAGEVRDGWADHLAGTHYAYPAGITATLAAFPVEWRRPVFAAIGALGAGSLSLAVLARLLVHRIKPWLAALLYLAFLTSLPLWYVGTQDPSSMFALLFLVLAMDGNVRFAAYGQTEGGFQAGLYLAVAFYFSPLALVYAGMLLLVAPLAAIGRRHQEPFSALPATLAVLAFPVVAVALGWTYIVWRLTGSAVGWFDIAWWRSLFPQSAGPAFTDAADFVLRLLWHSPLFLALGVLACTRGAAMFLLWLIPPLAPLVSVWLGLPGARSVSFLLLLSVAVTSSPARATRPWAKTLLAAAALAQIALNLAFPPEVTAFQQWYETVL
ncbi:hypothetical protein [Streptomyces sp. NPDC046909]|uniref:hypothetical protein n=1 Tax=Streptomyces sp. NPDC046909 TaxID=3155617 RepID=UPI0033FA0D80